MNRKCKLCNRRYWEDGVEPFVADDRFCISCAIEACELELARRESKDTVKAFGIKEG